ncbi:MAG: Tad domain-containing protein [Myxococcaceae bacterium]|nr:Tad domain-containing protein [Myxococcaceae bacterium]
MLWTRSLRQGMKRREGQAMVLGCLFMLILAIAVLTTVNLGHTIHERVKLQNTADSAAYSMAAMESRAFNLYAFVNRTHVSHYVAAMVWQSTLSAAYALEAFLTDIYGLFSSIDKCAPGKGLSIPWTAICPVLEAIPYVGAILKLINSIGQLLRKFVAGYQDVLEGSKLDEFLGRLVIPSYRVLNQVLTGLAQATLYSAMTHVQSTSQDVVAMNDPNLSNDFARTGLGLISSCIFERAHYSEAGVSFWRPLGFTRPLDVDAVNENDKVARAKRSMGNVTNATRFGADNVPAGPNYGLPAWVTDREPAQMFPLFSWLDPLRGVIANLIPDFKRGQTRMLSTRFAVMDQGRDRWRNYMRDARDLPNEPMSLLAQGDNLGSDDIYKISFGPRKIGIFNNPFACAPGDNPNRCWGDPNYGEFDQVDTGSFHNAVKPSIWAMNDSENPGHPSGGVHFRLVREPSPGRLLPRAARLAFDRPQGGLGNNQADIGLSKVSKSIAFGIPSQDIYVANVRPVYDGNHPWKGLAPFPHFEPGEFAGPCLEPRFGSGGGPSLNTAASRATEFNQPSTWAVFHKSPEELQNPKADPSGATRNAPALLNPDGTLKIDFVRPTKLELDNTRKKFLAFSSGLNVISRGQTYYHRPGSWTEQPNFFNPYWKPRLASVWQGRYSLPVVNEVSNALPGLLKSIPQKIITH